MYLFLFNAETVKINYVLLGEKNGTQGELKATSDA